MIFGFILYHLAVFLIVALALDMEVLDKDKHIMYSNDKREKWTRGLNYFFMVLAALWIMFYIFRMIEIDQYGTSSWCKWMGGTVSKAMSVGTIVTMFLMSVFLVTLLAINIDDIRKSKDNILDGTSTHDEWAEGLNYAFIGLASLGIMLTGRKMYMMFKHGVKVTQCDLGADGGSGASKRDGITTMFDSAKMS